jgi:hypothetical protein
MGFQEPRIVVKKICYKQLYLKERENSQYKGRIIESLETKIEKLRHDAIRTTLKYENNLSQLQFILYNMFKKNHEISNIYKKNWGNIFVSMIET